MISISDQEFEKLVTDSMDNIPEKYYQRIKNVAFVIEDQPSMEQRKKLKLACNQSLYGLYEGIPLTKRGIGYNLVLPDKITIFKLPITHSASSPEELKELVDNTVWHEVAHYFGLDHSQIHHLENKPKEPTESN
ncbi:metallopeptidase family protein [Candidatus Saccharibacteria bacterium]|nr:metallopeptidase family protein [Candidatus Saccharibacteria bacterium]